MSQRQHHDPRLSHPDQAFGGLDPDGQLGQRLTGQLPQFAQIRLYDVDTMIERRLERPILCVERQRHCPAARDFNDPGLEIFRNAGQQATAYRDEVGPLPN